MLHILCCLAEDEMDTWFLLSPTTSEMPFFPIPQPQISSSNFEVEQT